MSAGIKMLSWTIGFYAVLWFLLGLLITGNIIIATCALNKNPEVTITEDVGETGLIDFIGNAFNVVLFIVTLGVSSICGLPEFITYVLGIINSLNAIAIIYLLRGTN